jgi:tRNA(Ile)-lysidine synthase
VAALADQKLGKPAETIEEAARRLRYGWFRELMASGVVEAVATAHTRDDQAETVLAKFLRGAWTEGISGIHPVVQHPEGRVLRPFLPTSRHEIEGYLRTIGQVWREDSSNRHLTFTRNRIRHELLPVLEEWNPQIRAHLAQMAELARDEEAWWQEEMARLAPQLILPGRPVRGGGRAAGVGIAIDIARLAVLHPALQRRLLRYAAEQLGGAPDFEATGALRTLAINGRAGQRLELGQGFHAERTHRELQLSLGSGEGSAARADVGPPLDLAIPGEGVSPAFGLRVLIRHVDASGQHDAGLPTGVAARASRHARLRAWKPGDRVHLRHSGGPRKVKEVLERLRVSGSARAGWPVLEVDGRIVWMQGIELEPEPGLEIRVTPVPDQDGTAGTGGNTDPA